MRNNTQRPITTRRFSLFVLFSALFVILLVARFFQVMLLDENGTSTAGAQPPASKVERGPILDREGRVLAIQTRLYSVTAWMPNVKEPEETAGRLAPILNLEEEALVQRFRNESGFLYIRRKVSPSTSEKVRSLIARGKLPGISLEAEYGRNYPHKDLASHVLGFVGTDNVGLDGIELTHEQTLSPDSGTSKGDSYGKQLFLTLDLNIQYMAEKIADEALRTHKANSVMILVLDADSGEYLGLASAPDFDPNRFGGATTEEKRNRPLTYAYEPGSVFKVFSIASMMDLGGISPDSTFFCDGTYERTFQEDDTVVINCLGHHGEVDAQKIIQYSCNAGAAYASETVGKSAFYSKLRDFGFGSPTHLPLPGESSGLLRPPERWSGRTKPTIAIGQELSVTAAQIVTAATAIANDGMILSPHIVKKVVSSEGEVIKKASREALKRVVSPETARGIRLMMDSATEREGTAWRADIPHVRTAAKTGTAQIINKQTGRYSEEAFVASSLAIFPTDDPEIITYVAIDHPRGEEYYGGRIAAPLIRELGTKLVDYLGIPTNEETVVHHGGVIKLPQLPDIKIGSELPDFKGVAKRRLLPLLDNEHIDVTFEGQGWVEEQHPPPGTPVEKGMKIRLEFE